LVSLVHPAGQAVILLEREQETAGTIAEDAGRILNRPPLEIRVAHDMHSTLAELLDSPGSQGAPPTAVFVSPHEWVTMDQAWRNHPHVHLLPFQIREEAWDLIADVVGMPLGTLG
jgi:hypothetical protein